MPYSSACPTLEAAAAGNPGALVGLGRWLGGRPGREADAEAVYREAAAVGNLGALVGLGRWLGGRPGREADADRIVRYGLDAHGRTVKTGPS